MKVHHVVFAWAGAVLFAAAIGYFLFAYSITFGEITPGRTDVRPVLIDTVLFSFFALHHSAFARQRVRGWVRNIASPQLERSIYVWFASLMLIAVVALWRPVPGVLWQISGAPRWIFPAIQLAGLWLTLRSAGIIDVWELAGVRQATTPSSQPPTPNRKDAVFEPHSDAGAADWEFKTEGPYGWVRHPIYLGWIIIVFAVATMTMTRLLFAVISTGYILIAITFEERSLRCASGGAYDQYMRQVPSKLIPHVY